MRPYHSGPPTRADHRTWPVPTQRQLRIAEYSCQERGPRPARSACICPGSGRIPVLAANQLDDLSGRLADTVAVLPREFGQAAAPAAR
jgi:hypothetical protein